MPIQNFPERNRKEDLILKLKQQQDLNNINKKYFDLFNEGYLGFTLMGNDKYHAVWQFIDPADFPISPYIKKKLTKGNDVMLKEITDFIDNKISTNYLYIVRGGEALNQGLINLNKVIFTNNFYKYLKSKDFLFYELFLDEKKEKFVILFEDFEGEYLNIYFGSFLKDGTVFFSPRLL
ncbi:hypothetical protein [Flavobacterium polysaccharolyticum]|uniref:Uncharacterized protein n=1 Tax=Flavobacterium polysaccharolyticum TaxID=3133148 RepID=A0ABU9NTT3_9FLAO